MKKYIKPSIEIEELLSNDIMRESEGFNIISGIVDIFAPGENGNSNDGPTFEGDINNFL